MIERGARTPRTADGGIRLIGLGIVAFYLAVFALIPRGVFYSPDAGGKYFQMIGYRWDGGLQCDVIYPAVAVDPGRLFYGHHAENEHFTLVYPYRGRTGPTRTGWTPWFPLLTRPFHSWLGIEGLYVVPWLAGLVLIGLAGKLAERLQIGAGLPAAVVVALATPVIFYSMCFWEHTLALAFAVGAIGLLFSPPLAPSGFTTHPKRWIEAACLILASSVLRRENVLFWSALALAAGGLHPKRRRFAPIALAVTLLAAAACILALWHGQGNWMRWISPSVDTYAVRELRALVSADYWRAFPSKLCSMFFFKDYAKYLPPPVLFAGLAGLVVCVAGLVLRGPRRIVAVLAGAALVSAPAAVLAFTSARYRSLDSILLPAPLLMMALLPMASSSSMAQPRRLLGCAFCIFLSVVAVLLPTLNLTDGGLEWGLRYALAAIVLLNVLGVAAVADVSTDHGYSPRLRRATIAIAAWLAVLGMFSAGRGLGELQQTQRDLAKAQAILEERNEPVVTDIWWLGASLAPFASEHEIFIVSSRHPMSQWMELVATNRPQFVYAGYLPDLDSWETNKLPGLTLRRLERREAAGLFMTRYELTPRAAESTPRH